MITGQLYLGIFSGPVEGIIMIVAIYILTGIYGMHYMYRLLVHPLTLFV